MALVQSRRVLRKHCLDKINKARVCDTVNGFEAKTAPKKKARSVHASMTLNRARTAPDYSTLTHSALRQVVTIRLHVALPLGSGRREETAVEDVLADASATIVDLFHQDIDATEDGLIEFDPLGGAGLVLEMVTGYVDIDSTKFRFEDIHLPFVLYDVWEQVR